jgi:hypothetical protein
MEWINDDDFVVILQDGTVWKWHYYNNFLDTIRLASGLALLGIPLGWAVIVLAKQRKAAGMQASRTAHSA